MKTANQLISRSQPGSGSRRRPTSPAWSEQTEKYLTLVFARMADLFGPKCRVHGLEISDEDGRMTEAFKLWCRKCDGLTPKQFKHGMDRLEFTCARNAQAGDESWPPSYAEFIGYATHGWETAAHRPFERLALPDKGAEGGARKAGAAQIAAMKGLFGQVAG